ncbi:MAG: phosphoadenosine phosphosulfate reductase, partial [Ascidiaceihabitans sp.]
MLHSTAFDNTIRNDGRVATLNARLAHAGATEVIKAAFNEIGNVALVSSFGADSVVLLRLVAQ